LLLYYYITKRYIQALTVCSPPSGERTQKIGDIMGQEIAKMNGVTAVLMNLPKEFQRWNKYYSKEVIQQIKPADENGNIGENKIKRPFDVKMRLPACFRKSVTKLQPVVRSKQIEKFSLDLGPSWDPYVIACNFQANMYDIKVTDFFSEPPKLYKNGVAVEDSNEVTKMKSPRKRQPATEPTHSPKKQKQSPTKKQNGGSPTKNQPEPEKKSPAMTTTDVKNIICKNLKAQHFSKTAITAKLVESLNGIARDILVKVEGTTLEENTQLIEKADLLED
jgi:hypothetical protein